jgi:hypothetical protein
MAIIGSGLYTAYEQNNKRKFVQLLKSKYSTDADSAFNFFCDELEETDGALNSDWIKSCDETSGRVTFAYPASSARDNSFNIKITCDREYQFVFVGINLHLLQDKSVINLDGDIYPTNCRTRLYDESQAINNDILLRTICETAGVDYKQHTEKLLAIKEALRQSLEDINKPAKPAVNPDTENLRLENENMKLKQRAMELEIEMMKMKLEEVPKKKK